VPQKLLLHQNLFSSDQTTHWKELAMELQTTSTEEFPPNTVRQAVFREGAKFESTYKFIN